MSNNKKADEMRDLASKYLQKYDDTFTPKGYSSSSWAYEYSRVTFEAGKYPGSVVEVRAYKNDDRSYRFKDNYYKCYSQWEEGRLTVQKAAMMCGMPKTSFYVNAMKKKNGKATTPSKKTIE